MLSVKPKPIQTQPTLPRLEIQPSNPNQWEIEEQNSLIGFFKLLVEIDMRNNPENYKLKPESLKAKENSINQPNLISYEPNSNIRNTSNTSKA